MSYNVSITRNDIPDKDESAWNLVNKLREKDQGPAAGDFLKLIGKLTERYPCICDLPEDQIDDGVWSDGPLKDDAGKDITTLGVVFSRVDEVIPFLIKTANNLGFVVFDYQTEIISRPKRNSFFKKILGK